MRLGFSVSSRIYSCYSARTYIVGAAAGTQVALRSAMRCHDGPIVILGCTRGTGRETVVSSKFLDSYGCLRQLWLPLTPVARTSSSAV